MKINDKGEEIVQRYESFKIEIVDMKALGEIKTKKQRLDIDMDKEGVTLKKRDGSGSKFLDKRNTQVGGASL